MYQSILVLLPLLMITATPQPRGAFSLKGGQRTHAILVGIKRHEGRSQSYRPGVYFLHTSKELEELPAHLAQMVPNLPEETALPHGSVVGAVEFYGSREITEQRAGQILEFNDWDEKRPFISFISRASFGSNREH
jgi:hypothetical protein